MRIYLLLIACMVLVVGVVAAQTDPFSQQLLDTRADIEALATTLIGSSERPEDWTFNLNNLSSPTYVSDLWYDNELLATTVFGKDRPVGWIGAPNTVSAALVARNVRHDLELLADLQIGVNSRPDGWHGGNPLFRCDRTLQNLVLTLQSGFDVTFNTPTNTLNYCTVLYAEVQERLVDSVYTDETLPDTYKDYILSVRGDLERLADEKLGLNQRPPNWFSNKERESPLLTSDAFLDQESLADALLGAGQRPAGWIGSIPNSPILAYQNLRHDLELLANTVGQVPRPRGWQGINPIESCDPAVQNLATLVAGLYNFDGNAIPVNESYCSTVSYAANDVAENPPPPPTPEDSVTGADSVFNAESQWAFTYLDVAATQYMGMMPAATKFRAWYRNFNGSNMMFVSGENFAVFIDRRWTTLPQEIFDLLPTLEGVKPLTFCDALWCNGPGPTPTPTSSGPIELLLGDGTPVATPDQQVISGTKTQVSWNNLRVTYVGDNTATRTAQVALEICQDALQTICEPVVSIFDKTTNVSRSILSQFNGLNVFEFNYGYTSNLLIEGPTLFSPDIWVSDPTIR